MRDFSQSFRAGFEDPNSPDLIVVLLTLTAGASVLRVANDVVDYVYGGETYLGFPFQFELLTDSDRPPRGQLSVQNVDQRIGQAIQALSEAPAMEITVLADQDFGAAALVDGVKTRTEIGTPVVEYQASSLVLRNISVDAIAVTGEIQTYDYTSEPWPRIRTTPELLPGLEA